MIWNLKKCIHQNHKNIFLSDFEVEDKIMQVLLESSESLTLWDEKNQTDFYVFDLLRKGVLYDNDGTTR